MIRWIAPALIVLVASPGSATAQSDPEGSTVVTIRPAGEPRPALKYRLLPDRLDLVPGNAALFYHRAIERMLQTRYRLAIQDRTLERAEPSQPETRISDWIQGPIAQIPREEARAQLDMYGGVFHEVELGAMRRECDWGFDGRPETIELVIEEIQEARSIARLLSLRVRLAILDGDLGEALHWLQVGYALARHVSEGPTIIQGLVGIAIANVMCNDLMELIRAEGTPALYWAIAALPSPMIDMTPGLDGERSLVDRMFPEFRELDGPAWSVERGRLLLDRLAGSFKGFTESPPLNDPGAMRVLLTGFIARAYPGAKRTLIASGMSEEMVEAMPAIQAVGLVGYRRFRELSDDSYKWLNLPIWQSYRGSEEAMTGLTSEETWSNPGVALFKLLHPALSAWTMAQARLDRQLAALRCIEAIRLHAHEHGGRFPPSLDAIEQAPAPIDPATGEPFAYAVDEDGATLAAPLIPGGPDHPAYRLDYRLRMAE